MLVSTSSTSDICLNYAPNADNPILKRGAGNVHELSAPPFRKGVIIYINRSPSLSKRPFHLYLSFRLVRLNERFYSEASSILLNASEAGTLTSSGTVTTFSIRSRTR